MSTDSDGETPKKKVKATPPKKGGKLIKGGKSPAPNVKKEIKKAGDFFGAAPIKRSSYFNKTSTSGQTQVSVCVCLQGKELWWGAGGILQPPHRRFN